MTSRAGATKAQMAPLCRDSQQLWREAGPLLQQLEPPALALGTFIEEEPTGQSRVSLGTVTWHFIPATVSGPCAGGSHVSQLWKELCRFADWLGEKGFYRHGESGALLRRALRLPRVCCLQRKPGWPTASRGLSADEGLTSLSSTETASVTFARAPHSQAGERDTGSCQVQTWARTARDVAPTCSRWINAEQMPWEHIQQETSLIRASNSETFHAWKEWAGTTVWLVTHFDACSDTCAFFTCLFPSKLLP